MEIKISVGDKIIRADGLAGKITAILDDRPNDESPIAKISYENGDTAMLNPTDKEQDFHLFYLVGKKVLGNRVPSDFLNKEIADTKKSLAMYKGALEKYKKELIAVQETVERLEQQEKQLRKQKWRLEKQMSDDFTPQNKEDSEGNE